MNHHNQKDVIDSKLGLILFTIGLGGLIGMIFLLKYIGTLSFKPIRELGNRRGIVEREENIHQQFVNQQPNNQPQNDDDVDVDDDDEVLDDDSVHREGVDFTNVSNRQLKRMARKQEKKKEKQARAEYIAMQEQKREEARSLAAERRAQLEDERLEEEEAEREALEKQRRDEEHTYNKWKGKIQQIESGQDQNETELGTRIAQYIIENKIVTVDQIGEQFRLTTKQALHFVQYLQDAKAISGIFDDKGKFIHVTDDEMHELVRYIEHQGRISLQDLVKECNRTIQVENTM